MIIKEINLGVAKRGMSRRDLAQFEKSLSFGKMTNWPSTLEYRGTWHYYGDFGKHLRPKANAKKKAEQLNKSYPRSEFLIVNAAWRAGVPLYTRGYRR